MTPKSNSSDAANSWLLLVAACDDSHIQPAAMRALQRSLILEREKRGRFVNLDK